MDDKIMISIDKTLRDFGIDWILQDRGDNYRSLLDDLEIALIKVID